MTAGSSLFICSRWTLEAEPTDQDFLLSREKWVEFVDRHQELLTWYENTEQGKELARSLQSEDDSLPIKRLLEHNRAVGHFDRSKGYHKFAMEMYSSMFKVYVAFGGMRATRSLLLLSLELAEHLGVNLYAFGKKKPMTREWIDKNYPEKTK